MPPVQKHINLLYLHGDGAGRPTYQHGDRINIEHDETGHFVRMSEDTFTRALDIATVRARGGTVPQSQMVGATNPGNISSAEQKHASLTLAFALFSATCLLTNTALTAYGSLHPAAHKPIVVGQLCVGVIGAVSAGAAAVFEFGKSAKIHLGALIGARLSTSRRPADSPSVSNAV